MKKLDMNRARSVARLVPRETFGSDLRAFASLGVVDGGYDQSDLICAGLEELSRHLKWLDEDYQSGSYDRLEIRARAIVMLSDQLGQRQVGQVAADVVYCIDGPDEAALAATLSRLIRLMTMALDHAADPMPAV